MKTGRPIGENMLRICMAVELSAPAAPSQIARITGLRRNTVSTYLGRAVDRGMIVRHGHRYVIAENWRAIAGQVSELPPNSVFQMGERAGANP